MDFLAACPVEPIVEYLLNFLFGFISARQWDAKEALSTEELIPKAQEAGRFSDEQDLLKALSLVSLLAEKNLPVYRSSETVTLRRKRILNQLVYISITLTAMLKKAFPTIVFAMI